MTGERIFRKKTKLRGRDRKGIRASEIVNENGTVRVLEDFDEPKTMIETMRIVSDDSLTAQDTALYKYMLAHARDVGIDTEWHVLAMDTISTFLEVKDRVVRQSRIRDSIKRLRETWVTYDFRTETTRIDGSMPLILAQCEQDLASGKAAVRYSIPAPVRAAILEAKTYAMLQLHVFPLFKCRYTSRLYPRLAYYSSASREAGKKWEITPARLAEALMYPLGEDGKLHFSSFMRRAVAPALKDIKEFVKPFTVRMLAPVYGEGRGSPIEKLVFRISPTKRSMETTQAARLTLSEMAVIGMNDQTLQPHELPLTLVIGRAVTSTGIGAIKLSNGWRAAYEKAKADPSGECLPGLQGSTLVSVVEQSGVGAGFMMFAQIVVEMDKVPVERMRSPPKPAVPAAVVETVPVPVPVEAVQQEPPLTLSPGRKTATPEERLARTKEIVAGDAQGMLDALAGYHHGRQFKAYFEPDFFVCFCDPDTGPWDTISEHMKGFGTLAAALKVLQVTEAEQRKKSLVNLAYAVKAWDLDKLRRISGAILAGSCTSVPMPPPAPGRPRSAKGFVPTRLVTEASAEYDFVNPAYTAAERPWDDRDASDFQKN